MDVTPQDDILLLTELYCDGLTIPDFVEPVIAPKITLPKEAQIWAYLGVVGGVGVSSLVVQAAYELSQLHKQKTVCLIDLDFECGACAAYLDTPPSMTLEELNASADRMDADLAATFIGTYKKTFSIISAQGEMGGNDRVDGDALLALLDCVCGMFDFIILDIPPMWRTWTQAVIGASDEFSLVTEMRVPALHRTKTMSAFLTKSMELQTPPHVIINKHERREQKDSINLKDAQSVLGREVSGCICTDEETVRSAINCGQPAGLVNSDSRYVKSVRVHVHAWLGEEEVCEKPPISLFHRATHRKPKQDRRRGRKQA